MIDILTNININIKEKPFYKFNYLSYSEEFIPSEIDFSDIDSIINSLEIPDGITIYRYLAIGNTYLEDDEIKLILSNIEKTGILSEKEKLDSFFGYDVLQWGNLENIYFIPYKFSSTQTIYSIKNILGNYLFNLLPNKLVFTKENSFMFTFSSDNVPEISKNKLLLILNKKFIEGNLRYDKESIKYELESFFFPDELISELSTLTINDLIVELQDEKYNIFYRLKDRYVNCGYRLQDKFYNEVSSLPMPISYLEKSFNSKNLKSDPYNTNKIVRDITDNNEFYFYILNNLVSKLKNKKYDTNFNRFFPLLNEKNYNDVLKKEVIKEDEEKIIQTRKSYEVVSTIEQLYDNYEPNLKVLSSDISYLTLKHQIVFPNNYELLKLFNDLKLSYELPFIKFKDPISKDIIYKLYKPTTFSGGVGYLPIVSKDELTDWIKYYGFDPTNDKIVPIKQNPRELSIKFKLFDYSDSEYVEGKVRRVNQLGDLTYDIEFNDVIYPNVSLEFIKEKREYNISDSIKFKRFKTKYADANISLKGYVNFQVDLSDITNSSGSDIIKIISKFNSLLVELYNLESMDSVKSFQTKISDNNLTTKGDISDLLMSFSLRELSKPIIFSKLYSLLNIFYPYFIFDEIAFKVDDEVKYFDISIKQWVNAKVKELIGDEVKISIFDPKMGIKKEREEKVNRKFIRNKEEDQYRRFFNIRYKRVSNFDGGNAIRNLIMKLNNSNLSKSVILEKVEETFGISRELALKKLGDVMVSEGKTLEKIRGNIGVGVSIDWLVSSEKEYEIKLDNINSLGDLENVLKLIKMLFELYDYLINDKSNSYFETYNDFFENLIQKTVSENIEEQEKLSNIEHDENRGIEDELFRETEGDVFDVFGEIEEVEEEVPLEEKKEDLRKDIDREFREEILLVEGKHTSNNVILERLYEVDPELFDWKTEDGRTYSKLCQRIKRYPKVLDEKTKNLIDSRDEKRWKELPKEKRSKSIKYSYASENDDNQCQVVNDLKGSKTKCSAIKWGSDDENKYWYICPKIWDMYERIPLNISDLNYEYEGKPYDFQSLDITTEKWRTDKKTGKDITEFNPTYKGRSYLDESRQKVAPTPSKSLLFRPLGESYSYPGFLSPSSHPKGFYVPCCFQAKSMRVSEALGIIEDERGLSKHIKDWGKSLKPNEIGLVPPKLKKFLGLENMSNYTTGSITDKKAYFRCGIQQGNDMFLNLIGSLLGKTINSSEVKKIIVETLDEEIFKTLNRGELSNCFEGISRYSSFQNFLEYTLSDLEKRWEFYYDFLTRPNSKLFKDGLNLLIFDYSIFNNNEVINLICTDYLCEKTYNETTPIMIVLKNKTVMEPIFYYEGNFNPIKEVSVLRTKLYEMSKQCIGKSKFTGYSIINKKFSKLHNSVFGYDMVTDMTLNNVIKNFNLSEILYLVEDNYNKIVGFVLKNKLFIPVFPSEIPLNINIPKKMIDEIEDKLELEEALMLYNKQKVQFKLTPYIFLYKLNRSKRKVINGFICQYGLVIPLLETNIDSETRKVLNYIEVDKTIKIYKEILINSGYDKPDTLLNTLRYLEGILTITDDYEPEFEFLIDRKKYILGIILNCRKTDYDENVKLLIPVKKIYSRDVSLKKEVKVSKLIDIDRFKIENLSGYIEESGKLKRISNYQFMVLPQRALMTNNNEKEYTSIILESGLELELEESFSILSENDSRYIVNEISENLINNSIINSLNIEKVNIDIDNEMIKNVLMINYKKNIMESLRVQLGNFLNKVENRELKNLIISILEDIKLNNSQKKLIFEIIVKFLYSFLVKDVSIDSFPKVNSEYVLYSLTENECKELSWTSFSQTNIERDFSEIKYEFLTEYYKKLMEIIRKQENMKLCRLVIHSEYKDDFIDTLVEEIVRNRNRSSQIIYNKDLKKTMERYQWNRNVEVLFNSTELNNEFIANLYILIKQNFYSSCFPTDIQIEIPQISTESQQILRPLFKKIIQSIKNVVIEETGEFLINRNNMYLSDSLFKPEFLTTKIKDIEYISLDTKEKLSFKTI